MIIEERRVVLHDPETGRVYDPPREYDERVVYDRGPEYSFRRIIREEQRWTDGRVIVRSFGP